MNYGRRWIAEIVFSSIKGTFGEHVAARKFPHMVKEILLKAALYNTFSRMTYLAKNLMDRATWSQKRPRK